mmetsp:Transcript_3511/g.3910  ORF Transcript_3511/g.3910 Transcript_3511/m.3910 type:complete len:179 (-) Transcript_3511:203-739(-)
MNLTPFATLFFATLFFAIVVEAKLNPPTKNDEEVEETLKPTHAPLPAACNCLPDGNFAIKTRLNTYIAAEPDGDVLGDRDLNKSWEKFHAVPTGGTCQFGLRSNAHGKKYLRCPGKRNKVDQASKLRSFEVWTVTCISNGKVAFKGHRGFMSVPNTGNHINCDREHLKSWEIFEFESI